MDNLKLDATGLHKCTSFQIVTNLELDKDGRDHCAWAAV